MQELRAPQGSNKKKRIVGRGQGSGRGKTSGKGHKGQNSRSGGGVRPGFEGGQMPLYRRIARRGFSNHPFKVDYITINVDELDAKFADGDTIDLASLKERGVVRRRAERVKVLGDGELSKKLTVSGLAVSAGAQKKITEAGGTITTAEVES